MSLPPAEEGLPRPLISIIIPCYNEEARLPATLKSFDDYLLDNQGVLPVDQVELLIVDNDSRDGTAALAADFARSHSYARVVSETRRGKGAAVRAGMFAGHGRWLMFCDADLAMPFTELAKFLPPMRSGYDVAIASREVPGAVRYNEPAARHAQGRLASWLTKLVLGLPFEDTQCGYKSFERNAAQEIFARQTIDGFGFDFEILYIARKLGYRVDEVPIQWYHQPGSTVRPGVDTLKALGELWRVRGNARRGLYGRQEGGVQNAKCHH